MTWDNRKAGDGLQLLLSWPARQGRRIKRRAKAKALNPKSSLLDKVPLYGLVLLSLAVAVAVIVGVATIFMYILLALQSSCLIAPGRHSACCATRHGDIKAA